MKRNDLSLIILIVIVTGLFSLLASKLIFKSPASQGILVPELTPVVSPDMPDVKTDPVYQLIFNKKALDPSLPVKIGGSNNASPFNNNGQ